MGRPGDQAVLAEGLPVEEDAGLQAQAGIDFRPVAGLGQGFGLDPQGLQQAIGDGAIGAGAVDLQRSAVHQVQAAVQAELVALGVAAEVVVIVEDQDAGVWPRRPVEMRRRQAAEAGADNDQVIALAAVLRGAGALPEIPVAQGVGGLETARVAAAQSGQGGRIIAGPVLRPDLSRLGQGGAETRGAGADGDRDPIQEITPIDRPIQAKGLVPIPVLGPVRAGHPILSRIAYHNMPSTCRGPRKAMPPGKAMGSTAANRSKRSVSPQMASTSSLPPRVDRIAPMPE